MILASRILIFLLSLPTFEGFFASRTYSTSVHIFPMPTQDVIVKAVSNTQARIFLKGAVTLEDDVSYNSERKTIVVGDLLNAALKRWRCEIHDVTFDHDTVIVHVRFPLIGVRTIRLARVWSE